MVKNGGPIRRGDPTGLSLRRREADEAAVYGEQQTPPFRAAG
jgi:hypothetical protein